MPRAIPRARPNEPVRFGLVASAPLRADGSDTVEDVDGVVRRWTEGIEWDPEDCDGGSNVVRCGDTGPATPTVASDVAWTPWVIEASVQCSTFGSAERLAEHHDRARRKLLAVQSKRLEHELWTGTLAQAQGWANGYLARTGTVDEIEGGAAIGYSTALSELEQAIADAYGGQRGMIHATHRTVTKWLKDGVVRVDGNLMTTGLGTIVVPGRGYDGSSPTGVTTSADFDWAYATGIVEVWLGEIDSFDARTPQESGAVDYAGNEVTVTAYRAAAATFDGCLLAGALVDQTTDLSTTGS